MCIKKKKSKGKKAFIIIDYKSFINSDNKGKDQDLINLMKLILFINGVIQEPIFQFQNIDENNVFDNLKHTEINKNHPIKASQNIMINNSSQLSSKSITKNQSASLKKKMEREIKSLSQIKSNKYNERITKLKNYKKRRLMTIALKTINIVPSQNKTLPIRSPQHILKSKTENTKLRSNLRYKIINENKQYISERSKNIQLDQNRFKGLNNSLISPTHPIGIPISITNKEESSIQNGNNSQRKIIELDDLKYNTKYSFEKRITSKGDWPKKMVNIRKSLIQRNQMDISKRRYFTLEDNSMPNFSSFIMNESLNTLNLINNVLKFNFISKKTSGTIDDNLTLDLVKDKSTKEKYITINDLIHNVKELNFKNISKWKMLIHKKYNLCIKLEINQGFNNILYLKEFFDYWGFISSNLLYINTSLKLSQIKFFSPSNFNPNRPISRNPISLFNKTSSFTFTKHSNFTNLHNPFKSQNILLMKKKKAIYSEDISLNKSKNIGCKIANQK